MVVEYALKRYRSSDVISLLKDVGFYSHTQNCSSGMEGEDRCPERLFHYNDNHAFYRAMLCIRGTSHGPVSVCLSVCVCVCLSQAGVLLKWQNVGSHKQHHTIAQGL